MKRACVGMGVGTFVVVATFWFGLSAQGASWQDEPASTAASKTLFNSRCALCHGPDGHGSDMGKTLKVKDLSSKEVQSLSNDDLTQVISNGKNNMPPFKDALKKEEISGLVRYLRTLK